MKCFKCGKDKLEDEFYWRNKAKGTRQPQCILCKKAYNAAWYSERQEAQVARVARRRLNLVGEINKLKEAPCTDCGKSFPPVCMDFDHLSDKVDDISKLARRGWSMHRVLSEIAKCELVCACCHRLRTAARQSSTDGTQARLP